jgi:hypothetical protein
MRTVAGCLFVLGIPLTCAILLAPFLRCWLAIGSPETFCNLIAVAFIPGVACLIPALMLALASRRQ